MFFKNYTLYPLALFLFSIACNSTTSGGDTTRIVVYGDSQNNKKIHEKICKMVEYIEPDAVFHTGDLVDNSSDSSQWVIFNEETSKYRRKSKFYPALGNHDENVSMFDFYEKTPNGKHFYSVDISTMHLILLNTNQSLREGTTQYTLLVNDLKLHSGKSSAIIVLFHHPPFACATGKHDGDEKNLRGSIVPLFDLYGVKLVFSGHNHLYERIKHKKTWYIITGGAGGELHTDLKKCHNAEVQVPEHHLCELICRNGELRLKVMTIDKQKIDDLLIEF